MPAGRAARIYGGGEAQAHRLQATTASLHEDVLLAQMRLQRIRSVNIVSAAAQPSAWIQRALARIGEPIEGADGATGRAGGGAAAAAAPAPASARPNVNVRVVRAF